MGPFRINTISDLPFTAVVGPKSEGKILDIASVSKLLTYQCPLPLQLKHTSSSCGPRGFLRFIPAASTVILSPLNFYPCISCMASSASRWCSNSYFSSVTYNEPISSLNLDISDRPILQEPLLNVPHLHFIGDGAEFAIISARAISC